MSKYFMLQDQQKCIGCHSCEIQCKCNKGLPPAPRLCQVIEVGPKYIDAKPRASYIFMPCFHCENPWCVAACPTGAMQRREKDGIVWVDHDLCVGCNTCISACPWGAPGGLGTLRPVTSRRPRERRPEQANCGRSPGP